MRDHYLRFERIQAACPWRGLGMPDGCCGALPIIKECERDVCGLYIVIDAMIEHGYNHGHRSRFDNAFNSGFHDRPFYDMLPNENHIILKDRDQE